MARSSRRSARRLRDHLVGAFHHAERGRQRASRGVFERFARLERRLLADDAGAADFFDVARAVGDDPVAGQQLDGLLAFVRDRDGIEEEPLVLRRLGLLRGVLRLDRDADAAGHRFRGEHTSHDERSASIWASGPRTTRDCANECRHVQVVTSARGSRFYLCRLSFSDPRFPRYPPIPVLQCGGYQPAPEGPRASNASIEVRMHRIEPAVLKPGSQP